MPNVHVLFKDQQIIYVGDDRRLANEKWLNSPGKITWLETNEKTIIDVNYQKEIKSYQPIKRKDSVMYDCPVCGDYAGWLYDRNKFCPNCSSKLDWSDFE